MEFNGYPKLSISSRNGIAVISVKGNNFRRGSGERVEFAKPDLEQVSQYFFFLDKKKTSVKGNHQ